MAQGNQYDYVPGYDYPNNIQQMGMYYWDTQALAYVRWQGSSTTPDVAIANFPAVTTVTGSLTTSPPAVTTVTGAVYVASVTAFQGTAGSQAWPVFLATTSVVGNVGISGSVVASLSGINFVIATPTGSQGISGNVGATQSGAWAVGVSGGNIAATQSGIWNVGINTGAQVAIASIGGTNFIIATLSTGTSAIGAAYDVSGILMNERGALVSASTSFANATTTGYLSAIAAQGTGVIIRVLAAYVMSQDFNTCAFFSGTNGTGSTISSTKPVPAYGGWVWPYNPHGWCETGPNQVLSFYQSVATNTGIDLTWATVN